MSNWDFYQILLEIGIKTYSFVIVNDTIEEFDNISVNYLCYSYPVWTEKSTEGFVNVINDTDGIFYILNEGINPFKILGGFVRMFQEQSIIAQRQRKIGKVKSDIFKKQIISFL